MVQDCAQKAMYALHNSKIKMEDTDLQKSLLFSKLHTIVLSVAKLVISSFPYQSVSILPRLNSHSH